MSNDARQVNTSPGFTLRTNLDLKQYRDPEPCLASLRRWKIVTWTTSHNGNPPESLTLAPQLQFSVFFIEKDRLFPPIGNPALFSTISGSGRARVFRTTSRSPFFCGKCRAPKLHGVNPFKMLLFQKYINKTIFSSGVGTTSTAEFPGLYPPGISPSENRSRETYNPPLCPLYKGRIPSICGQGSPPGVRVLVPLRLHPSKFFSETYSCNEIYVGKRMSFKSFFSHRIHWFIIKKGTENVDQ